MTMQLDLFAPECEFVKSLRDTTNASGGVSRNMSEKDLLDEIEAFEALMDEQAQVLREGCKVSLHE
jgi:hypothetical protein